jgi:dUTP pyrophosphatase
MPKFDEFSDFDEIKKEVERLEKMFADNPEEEDKDFKSIYETYGIDMEQLEQDLDNFVPKKQLGYLKIHQDAVEPKYNYPTDSGFDLHSVDEIILPPFGRALVPTGLCFDIPDSCEIQVRPKSGLAINQGLTVLNTPGTADCGYTGEIKVIVFNTNPTEFKIPKGMKVAQAVFAPVLNGKWVDLVKLDKINEKDRGSAGFGSTGI